MAPLTQYGLALFGSAILLTALLSSRAGASGPTTAQPKPPAAYPTRLLNWLQRRLDLAIPAALFLAGSLSSYFLTLRHQSPVGGFAADSYLAAQYYSGGLDPLAILSFAATRLWSMMNYHLPAPVLLLTLLTLGILLLGSRQQRRLDPIILLFLTALSVAVGTALLQLYPLGGSRQSLYLGPIVFLTAGVALAWAASRLAALSRRPGLRPALLIALAALAALSGIATLQQRDPYQGYPPVKEIIALLEQQARPADLVCIASWESAPIEFYLGPRGNYRYGCTQDWIESAGGLPALLSDLRQKGGRLYLLVGGDDTPDYQKSPWQLAQSSRHGYLEQLVSGGPQLWRLSAQIPPELPAAYHSLRAQAPDAPGEFDLYLDLDLYRRENTLHYLKEPCLPGDNVTGVFLEIIPAFPDALSQGREQESSALTFGLHNKLFAGKCLATITLPEYPIAAIRAGQFTKDGTPSWTSTIPVDRPALYRAAWAALAGTAPVASAVFDLYLHNHALHYVKEPCAPSDTATRFFLHLVPADPADLPPAQQPYGIGNQDFDFAQQGAHFDGKCLALLPLPDYPIAGLITSQSDAGNRLWQTAFPLDRTAEHQATYAALTDIEPAARSNFDLYLQNNNLHYVRESCTAADTTTRFFLHLIPANPADLPPERQPHGIANHDFDFPWRGAVFDGKCLATIPLPDYPIAGLITGQDAGRGRLWETTIALDRTAEHQATYAALAGQEPAARAAFDLYLQDNNLHYVRAACAPPDTAARFFLHIIPSDPADLPPERQQYGIANRDFAFPLRGAIFDGKCLATVPLPDYPIAALRTGQFIPGQEPAWTAEFSP